MTVVTYRRKLVIYYVVDVKFSFFCNDCVILSCNSREKYYVKMKGMNVI
jgi:hypothetical protein